MKIIYNNKDIDCKNAKNFFDRFKGFMLQKNIDSAILFEKCNSIHTFFMKENIDVIMLDKNNKILFIYKNLSSNKVILPKKGVYKTIETPAYYFDNIKVNDYVKIKP